jgi:hypothetical protein
MQRNYFPNYMLRNDPYVLLDDLLNKTNDYLTPIPSLKSY